MIEIKNLVKDYYVDKEPFSVLKGISMTFSKVQFACILGPSGCGKTTLLNLIGGLDKITSGDIYIDSASLKNMSEKDLDSYRNDQIGFVFQNSFLIPNLTILDNVKLALDLSSIPEEEAKKKALDALAMVGLEKCVKKRPGTLSGGQQQRAVIARAIVTDPKILLADEPTGALDSETAELVMNILKDLSKTRLVIMVSHNESLAMKYSDRIIRMKDGKVVSDEILNSTETSWVKKQKSKTKLSFKSKMKLALKSIISKKGKTTVNALANSFGMISIAFILALNNGYTEYATNLSAANAATLPVIVTSYDVKTSQDTYSEHNASIQYPNSDEIYPSVTVSTEVEYRHNYFSKKYIDYLDSLQKEGIIHNYVKSYGNQYSFHLSTERPVSLDGTVDKTITSVNTTITSYNSYAKKANLPYNIFHVLYGDLNQYDLIEGSLPKSENDLVLVVDEYNSVSFNILKSLGFYAEKDTQDDVKDQTLASKVKPIKFSDVIGKEYRIFDNSQYYSLKSDDAYSMVEDEHGNLVHREDSLGFRTAIHEYSSLSLNRENYERGRALKITGILRPKRTSPFVLLSPALCYSPSLQDILMTEDTSSDIASKIKNNFLFDCQDGTTPEDFGNELVDLFNNYKPNGSELFPTNELNEIIRKYFIYYPIVPNGRYYRGFSTFLDDARKMGSDLIPEHIYQLDISDREQIQEFAESIVTKLTLKMRSAYDDVIGLIAYINAYSSLDCVVIFPSDLSLRTELLKRLEDFNKIQKNSANHASSEYEVIRYSTMNNSTFLEDIAELISMVSLILVIFAILSLSISSLMTMNTTSNAVLERKSEIGLLRALGSKKSDVTMIFEIESFVLGFLSGLIGSILTFIFAIPINYVINSKYSSYHIGQICHMTWWHGLIVIGISIALALIAALLPSIKAGKMKPVDALRSE